MVLSRFEVCDVTFERELNFFNNDYQVINQLSLALRKLIAESEPDYLKADETNCPGSGAVWDFQNDAQKKFYEALVAGKGSEAAEKWYKAFDEIEKSR
jgi:hypothetical protein